MSLIENAYTGILEPALIEEIEAVATLKTFQSGDIIIDIGQYIRSMPLLLTGAIKIMREDEKEGELLLYYLAKGETCTMSIACCLGNKKSEIRAQAEMETVVAMIPNQYLNEWLVKYSSWRSFILNSYSSRMNEMLGAIDNLAFSKMEDRIMNYLKEKVKLTEDRILTVTHQDIALDLNTSRVVVSRILKKLENEDKIVLLRNEIRVLV
ncbi:Crp/Fnr family transcriptional regulator [Sphingobacterium mizutaii NBRC 14946 = DSM 11724]|uniref:DNA-binding transcriptional dual regulator Crp n=2 Tax=Sphingobacterium mizutaii TaxID=1010 RepID=A0AAJ5BZL1_9SPHI|nr:Crp/Fnr family transcriptional regulator [Sphingobacterium mizutaii]GEM68525.1 Crp/Fnr family transcriptional regulator [Sphingobacterium mizutaii NBRC 14946 = DSM 11724]SDK88463.1 CRP/FNR family transcriptional regulator, anaerobic regulatory protein [Sphingobacterium mizutaii]SNV46502.1 DNA-binding transcriptional dual regulator Crp [Sphingobacterium mizutaii]